MNSEEQIQEKKESKEKRYFWFRFRDDFFQNIRIKKLLRLPDGYKSLVLLQKVWTQCLKTDGVFYLQGLEPNVALELSLAIDETPEDTLYAIMQWVQCGLMVANGEDKALFFPDLPELLGSETAAAARQRTHRQKKIAEFCGEHKDVVTLSQPCHGEIELKKELQLESEKELNLNKELLLEEEKEKKEEKNTQPLLHNQQLSDENNCLYREPTAADNADFESFS